MKYIIKIFFAALTSIIFFYGFIAIGFWLDSSSFCKITASTACKNVVDATIVLVISAWVFAMYTIFSFKK